MERGRNHDVLLIRGGGGGGAGRNRDVLLFRAGGGGGGDRDLVCLGAAMSFSSGLCVYTVCVRGWGGVHGCVCADSLDVLLSSLWWP